ncbi:MAG: G5 domain-containing protein [Chloroflexi bacterium]|nr:G5 domain-containing protein [Chloroflexota bacterium]
MFALTSLLCYYAFMRWLASRFVFLALGVFLFAACAQTSKRVVLAVDGTQRVVDTQAVTVQDFLREQSVALGDNDRVDPPVYAEIGRSAAITITRVEIKTETERLPLPFTRKLIKDEAYPENQMRVIQLGTNGALEITYAITREDGVETARRETARKTLSPPKDEILALGTQGSLPTVSLASGAVIYLANGNAWVMRHSNQDKRPLTITGDLDGRVFSISADARVLLFTRAAEEESSALNSLWVVDTLVLGETARALPIKDVIAAQLAPDARTLAYSTGVKVAGAPGWKANNDLIVVGVDANLNLVAPRQVIWKASIPGALGWWGGNLAWSPDGRALAYAFPSEIGYTDVPARAANAKTETIETLAPRKPLKRFAPFATHADWVWLPSLAWSPDNRFIVSVVHAPLENPNVASENSAFEAWAFSRDGAVSAPLAKQIGMWAFPQWSPPDEKRDSRIAFGIALSPSDSERSRYALAVMDRDGGNKKQFFPTGANESGLLVPHVAWSPNAKQLIAVRDGDLWLYDFASNKWAQLTANGASSLPRWGR